MTMREVRWQDMGRWERGGIGLDASLRPIGRPKKLVSPLFCTLRLCSHPSTLGLPARLLCPSRFTPSAASPCMLCDAFFAKRVALQPRSKPINGWVGFPAGRSARSLGKRIELRLFPATVPSNDGCFLAGKGLLFCEIKRGT